MRRDLLAAGRRRAVVGQTNLKPQQIKFLVMVACVGALVGCFSSRAPISRDPEIPGLDAGRTYDAGFDLDAGIPPLQACSLLNAARCKGLARCGLIADDAASLSSCVRGFEATWCGPTTWPNHVTAGALRLDSARAVACANALEVQTCSSWPALPDPCTRFLLPRVALGQPCFDGFDECLEGVCRGNACPRTCQTRALEGETCSSDNECRSGLHCRAAALSPVTVCAAPASAESMCFSDRDCATGLICSKQACKVLPPAGAACLDGRCNESAYCEIDSLGGMCFARKLESERCVGDQCAPTLLCDAASEQCVRKFASMHERCTQAQQCPTGSVCVRVDASGVGTCAAPSIEGEECVADSDCEKHLGCMATDGGSACARRNGTGEQCASNQQCRVSDECTNAACSELPLPGESCTATRSCRWGLCRDVAGSNGGAICGALLSPGATCRSDAECASNSCKESRCLARCVP